MQDETWNTAEKTELDENHSPSQRNLVTPMITPSTHFFCTHYTVCQACSILHRNDKSSGLKSVVEPNNQVIKGKAAHTQKLAQNLTSSSTQATVGCHDGLIPLNRRYTVPPAQPCSCQHRPHRSCPLEVPKAGRTGRRRASIAACRVLPWQIQHHCLSRTWRIDRHAEFFSSISQSILSISQSIDTKTGPKTYLQRSTLRSTAITCLPTNRIQREIHSPPPKYALPASRSTMNRPAGRATMNRPAGRSRR
jgi:hypothetical protein